MFKQRLKILLRAFPRSLYDPLQYREVVTIWTGFGGWYLFLLSLIVSLVIVAFIGYSAHLFGKTEFPYLLKQVPEIVIEKGEAHVTAKQPITIQTSDKMTTILVDTGAREEDFEKQNPALALGKNFVLVKKGNDAYERRGLENFQQKLVINQDSVNKVFHTFVHLLPIVIYPIAVISQWVNYLFQAFIIALCSYILTSIIGETYRFETRMRLSALALTPAVLITTIALIGFQHQMAMWFNTLLALLFLYVMILMNRRGNVRPTSGTL